MEKDRFKSYHDLAAVYLRGKPFRPFNQSGLVRTERSDYSPAWGQDRISNCGDRGCHSSARLFLLPVHGESSSEQQGGDAYCVRAL